MIIGDSARNIVRRRLNFRGPPEVSMTMRLLRGLSGRVLPCGCLVGVYETYEGDVVATIDARGKQCQSSDHRLHATIPVQELDQDETLSSVGRQLTP